MSNTQPVKPRIALKIDVPTYRATLDGVPVLADILRRHEAGASFVFALSPDWLGRTPGHRCSTTLHRVREAGFEVGVHGWNATQWAKRAEEADAVWTETQITQAIAAFEEIFTTPPRLHAAPGWCSNPHGLRLTQRLNFSYASDTRGRHPFVPVWNGEIVRCPQFPTTLPTLDELADNALPALQTQRDRLLALTENLSPLHVFSLRISANIARHPEIIEELLTGWHAQGYEISSIQSIAASLDMDKLPRHEIMVGTVPGRCGNLLLQGNEFLSAWRHPS
jgi:undecaprenyl phosphate-alpha-L-ara4FN deformylase